METNKGKEWLNSKQFSLVAFEINSMSNNTTTKNGAIRDMQKMADFLINAGICRAGNKHTLHGIPFLVVIQQDEYFDNSENIETDRFKMWSKKKYENVKESATKRGINFDLTLGYRDWETDRKSVV